MARPSSVALPASTTVTLAEGATIPRGCILLASDLRSRLVVSDGCSSVSLFNDVSQLGTDYGAPSSRCSSPERNDNARQVTFASVSQAHLGCPIFVALAEGCTIDVIAWESGSASTLSARSLGSLSSAEPHRWLGASWHPEFGGLLAAICQAEVRLVLCHAVGHDVGESGSPATASTPYSQQPTAPLTPTPAPGELLTQMSRLPPPGCLGTLGTRGPGPCRSVQCHVAWVGTASSSVRHGASGASGSGQGVGAARAAAASDLLTLVVGWGPELELISWSAAALSSAAVAAAAAACNEANCNGGGRGGGGGSGGSQSQPLAHINRRTLLLGVPGPLCAVSLGPYGSVLATTEAGLALSYSTAPAGTAPAAAEAEAAEVERQAGAASAGAMETAAGVIDGHGGRASGGALGSTEGGHNGQQQEGRPQQQATEVIDLRGLRAAGGSSLTQLGGGGGIGGGDGEAGPSLAGLFNISSGLALWDDDSDGGGGGGGGWQGARAGTRGPPAAAATVPRQFLRGSDESEAPEGNTDMRGAALRPASGNMRGAAGSAPTASASALCVVWPGSIALAASRPGPTAQGPVSCGPPAPAPPPAADPSADGDLDGFRSLAPLHLPRPDLLSSCGGLVLVASSLGQPTVIAFRLAPRGGLTRLACLTPAWPPDVVTAGRGRLRGLAAVWAPPAAGSAAAAAPAPAGAAGAAATSAGGREGWQHAAAGNVARDVMLVTLIGEVESPPAGGGIFGFGRSGRPVGQKMARLVASAHPLPSQLAACACDNAAAAAAAAADGVAPPLAGGAEAVEATPDAAATAAPLAPRSGAEGSAPLARGSGATASASASAADAIVAAVVGQLAELLTGFRRHVDERMDRMEGSLGAMAARLDVLEAALAQQQRP